MLHEILLVVCVRVLLRFSIHVLDPLSLTGLTRKMSRVLSPNQLSWSVRTRDRVCWGSYIPKGRHPGLGTDGSRDLSWFS